MAATMQHMERQLPVGAAVLAAGLHRMRPPAVPDVCRCGTAEVDLQVTTFGIFVYHYMTHHHE